MAKSLSLVKNEAPSDSPALDVCRRLLAHKTEIIEMWRERLKTDLPRTKDLPDPLLLDALPIWLDRLIQTLATPDAPLIMNSVANTAREHGKQRIRLDFNLEQLLYEYAVVQNVLFDVIESEGPLAARQRNIILDAVQLSARNAAATHAKLQRRRSELEVLKRINPPQSKRILLSFVVVVVATVTQWFAWPIIQPLAYFLFYPAVIVASLIGNGTVAIALSVIAAQFIFIPSKLGFQTIGWREEVRVLIFALTAFLISTVTTRLRKSWQLTESALAEQEAARQSAEDSAESSAAARAELERTLTALKKERELRERMIAAVSHDLRGPLTVARSNIEMLSLHPVSIETAGRMVSKALSGIDHANLLIEDLLDANRIQAGQKLSLEITQCDLVKVAQDVIEEFSSQHPHKFKLASPAQLTGCWSRSALRRILENLCSNAIKYGTPDSQVTVTLSARPEIAEISVHNFGSFISDRDQETLFKLFGRTRDAVKSGKKGWGIGLTIVKGLAEALGGSVSIKSVRGSGTTFSVFLPLDSRQ